MTSKDKKQMVGVFVVLLLFGWIASMENTDSAAGNTKQPSKGPNMAKVAEALNIATAAVKVGYQPHVIDALAQVNKNDDDEIVMLVIVRSNLTAADCKHILYDYVLAYQTNGPGEPPPNMKNDEFSVGKSNFNYNLIAQDRNDRKCAQAFKLAGSHQLVF